MSWLVWLRLLLSIADKVADIVRTRQLVGAGEQKEIAAHLARIAHSVRVAKLVSEETARMSDADLDTELMGDDA